MDEPTGKPEPSEDKEPRGLRAQLTAMRKTLLGAFGIMMVASTLAAALNYVFSIVMTGMLGAKGEFSSFNSLNSLFLITLMGAASVQTVVTKYVAEFDALGQEQNTRHLARSFSKWLLIIGGVAIVVSFAVAWPLAGALNLSSPLFIIILGTSVAAAFYITFPYGLLQGQQRFIGLGAAAISAAVLRILTGAVMVAIGLGVYGALGAGTVSAVLVALVVLYYYRGLFRGEMEPAEDFHPSSAMWSLVPVAVAIFLVILMTQIDVVLVRAFWGLKSPVTADRYSYAALAGKAALFFPEGIVVVMFPRVSELRARGLPTRRVLWLSLAAALVLVGAVVGFYALFPGFTADFFTAGKHGKELAAIPSVLGINFVVLFGAVMAIFALVKLLAFYHLALNRRLFITFLAAGAVAEVVGIALFHDTLGQILVVMLAVGASLLVVNLALALKERPGPPGKAAPEEIEETTIAASIPL
jgi:O-antigen/teichoic acid export membrane protein